MNVNDIKKEALRKGACASLRTARTLADLASVLKTPQGLEFFAAKGFPSLLELRSMDCARLAAMGVYVDAGTVELQGESFMLAIGLTRIKAICSGANEAFRVIAASGAEVSVRAENYAVVFVSAINGGEVEISKTDNAKVLWATL